MRSLTCILFLFCSGLAQAETRVNTCTFTYIDQTGMPAKWVSGKMSNDMVLWLGEANFKALHKKYDGNVEKFELTINKGNATTTSWHATTDTNPTIDLKVGAEHYLGQCF